MFGLRANRRVLGALMVGLFATSSLVGCGETSESTTKVEQKTPTGSTTETVTDKVKQTGDNPPAPTGTATTPAPK